MGNKKGMGKFHISKTTQNLGSCYGPVSFWEFSLGNVFGGLGWMNWLGWMSWLGGMRTADFFIVLRNLITFPMFFLIFFAGSFFHICWYFLNKEFFHNFAQLKNRPTAHTKHYGNHVAAESGFWLNSKQCIIVYLFNASSHLLLCTFPTHNSLCHRKDSLTVWTIFGH